MSGMTLLALIAYVTALKYIGYIPSTLVMLIGLMRFAGQKSWIRTIVIAVVLTAIIYFSFSKLLLIRMP